MHAEEIAFYQGSEREKEVVNASFERIRRHSSRVSRLHFFNGIFDSVATKYCATMLAYYVLARPVFDKSRANENMGLGDDPTKIMEDYSRNSGYLVNLSQAAGRVILAGRDLTRFAGYAARVSELLEVLDDVNEGKYVRSMLSDEGSQASIQVVTANDLKGTKEIRDNVIRFQHVPIVTPNGDVLVKDLNLEVKQGMNVLITGPNGCGKVGATLHFHNLTMIYMFLLMFLPVISV